MHSSIFEAVFNSGPAGNYLLSATPEATILAVNDAFLAATSRQRSDLIGVSLFVAFPGNSDDPEDSGENALRAALARTIDTGMAQAMPVQRYPIRVVLPNGEVGYEERYWSAVNTPIFDGEGRLVCISHTTTDVSDKVRSESSLRDSEGRLRAFFTATSDVIYRMSAQWTHMHALDGRGFLKDTADWAEYRIEDYVPAEDVELARTAINRAIEGKSVFELEHRVMRADGSFGWTYSRAVPMLDADGEIGEWIGAASDISERRTAEEKLRDTDRRKDEFLAMLAHELRNPLAPISSAAQLLQLADIDPARVRRTSEIIARQVKHMTALVDDLLDVSRVTRGLVELDNTAVDMRQIVAEAVEQSTPLIQSRRHQLTLQLAPASTMVMGDRKRLVQVMANLLNNAAKFTPEGGMIEVMTETRDALVMLHVMDNGIGIDPPMIERVFNLFAQAEVSSDRSTGGLGLGLALVKSIVELHGGAVTCQSAGAGNGTRFTVSLPRLVLQGDALPHQLSALAPSHARALRVMVVDDNVDAAEMMSMLLEAAGHEVLVEHSPARALERARMARPHVCLLDLGLPEMDGNELARRLRAQAETARCMLVAVTGYGQDTDRRQSLRSGFDHHLVKPVDTAQLAAILAGIAPTGPD